MRHSALPAKLVAVAMAAALLASGHGGPSAKPAHATQPESGHGGTLASRVFIVFDEDKRMPLRQVYKVWDPDPARKLDFTWTPDDPRSAVAGLVSGTGVLTWRESGRAALDASAIVSVYRGGMREGRAEGQGEFRSRDGVRYEGHWRNGLHDGQGRLQLADTTSYDGQFRAGKYEGWGTLVLPNGQTYVGPFRGGLRDGLGRTRLQSGASYESSWDNDVEVDGTRHVLVAQGAPFGVIPLQFSDGSLKISFRTDVLMKAVEFGPGEVMAYRHDTGADRVSVYPDDKRLMAAWSSKGRVSDDFMHYEDGGFISYPPVALTVRLQNSGSQALKVRRAFLKVDQSRTFLHPLVAMFYPPAIGRSCAFAESRTWFPSHGWSRPVDLKLEYGFSKGNVGTSLSRAKPVLAKGKAGLEGVLVHDFKSGLLASGFKVLGETPCTDGETDAACKRRLTDNGSFGRFSSAVEVKDGAVRVPISGRITYGWKDSNSAPRTVSLPFDINLLWAGSVTSGCAEGATPPDYDPASRIPVKLQLDQAAYEVKLPLTSASIAPGRVAQYALLVEAPKSSQHMMRFALELETGQVVWSKPLDLLYFMPRVHPLDLHFFGGANILREELGPIGAEEE